MPYCSSCKKEVKQVVGSGIECPICETTLSFKMPKAPVKKPKSVDKSKAGKKTG